MQFKQKIGYIILILTLIFTAPIGGLLNLFFVGVVLVYFGYFVLYSANYQKVNTMNIIRYESKGEFISHFITQEISDILRYLFILTGSSTLISGIYYTVIAQDISFFLTQAGLGLFFIFYNVIAMTLVRLIGLLFCMRFNQLTGHAVQVLYVLYSAVALIAYNSQGVADYSIITLPFMADEVVFKNLFFGYLIIIGLIITLIRWTKKADLAV